MLLKNRNGFILLDLLLTLSAVLIFLSFILPSTLSLINFQDSQQYYLTAEDLYNDILKKQITNEEISVHNTIIYKDKEFTININQINTRVLEYCITWIDFNNIEESMCRYVPNQ